MSDSFQIIVQHKDEEKAFEAELLLYGYSYQIKVRVNDLDIYFEPDDAGSYRVIRMPWQKEKDFEKIDRTLLYVIQQQLEEILKWFIHFIYSDGNIELVSLSKNTNDIIRRLLENDCILLRSK